MLQERMFKVRELAQRWNVAPKTVLMWIKNDRLLAMRTPGGHYRVSGDEVRRFENGQVKFPEGEPVGLHLRGIGH